MTKQIVLELTTVFDGRKVFIASPAVHVSTHVDYSTKKQKVIVADGIHNNGGFQVTESYEEIVAQIKEQLK